MSTEQKKTPSLFGQMAAPAVHPPAKAPAKVQETRPAPADGSFRPVSVPKPAGPEMTDAQRVFRWARTIWHEFEDWEVSLATGVSWDAVKEHLAEFKRMGIVSLRQEAHRNFWKLEAQCHVPGLDPDPAPAPAPSSSPKPTPGPVKPPMKHEPLPKAPFQPVAGSIAGAYKADQSSESQRAQVSYELLHAGMSGLTREEIARKTGIKESSLCGRLSELKASGHVIEPDGLKRESSSGVKVQVYVLARFAKHFEPKTGDPFQ
jgi:hypothetical protein